MSVRKIGSMLLKTIGYGAALVVPPLVAGAIAMSYANAALISPAPQGMWDPTLQAPGHDPHKPTVIVLASNDGTEITDFLAPYEVFAATAAFNVYAVAPKREFTPFLWGGLDFIPHYSFAELEEVLVGNPDVIVIPYIKNPEDPQITQWIRDHAGENTLLISICGGAHVLAETGLLDGGKVTTHNNYFPLLESRYPHLELVRGVRFTDNGNTITSAGITAGIDASLYAVGKLLGKQAALDVAHKLNYPHAQFLDAPAYQVPERATIATIMSLNAGFLWNKQEFGVYLFEGVGEIDLTAILDSYGRTFTARTITFASERKVIHSRYGLRLVPRLDFAGASRLDRILVPGDVSAPAQDLVEWAGVASRLTPEYLYGGSDYAQAARPFAFDMTIADLARHSSEPDARISAVTLEYPVDHLQLQPRSWPIQRLFSAVAVGVASLGAVFIFTQLRRDRRRIMAAAA